MREGIDPTTACQYQATNDAWKNYGFNLTINYPPPRDCPVKLDYFGQPVSFAGIVDAPIGVAISPLFYRFFDARDLFLSGSAAYFAPAPNGKEAANISGAYQAGWQGNLTVNQDRLRTEVGLYPTPQIATNDTWLPYQCCGVILSVARVPRAKVGRATTLRVYPRGINPSRFDWYLNGVKQSTPCNNPWNTVPSCGSAFTKTYSAAGTYNWKVLMIWGFPEQVKTLTFTQAVDP